MPNITAFTDDNRPSSIGDLISLKPTSITVKRGNSTLSAQTVRLETLASQRAVVREGGITHQIDAVLLGYRNHSTIADCDIQAGDRFAADGLSFEVVVVMPDHRECIQAYLRLRS